jgi:hypothetical protein
MEAVEHRVASSLAKVEPPILARPLEAIRSSSLDRSPLPAGEEGGARRGRRRLPELRSMPKPVRIC